MYGISTQFIPILHIPWKISKNIAKISSIYAIFTYKFSTIFFGMVKKNGRNQQISQPFKTFLKPPVKSWESDAWMSQEDRING